MLKLEDIKRDALIKGLDDAGTTKVIQVVPVVGPVGSQLSSSP